MRYTNIPESGHAKRSPLLASLRRGFRRRCPRCGLGRLFSGYLSVPNACASCGLEYEPIRSDDVPAYFTIVVVGHVIVPLVLWTEQIWAPPTWLHMAIWLPLTVILTLALLPYIKGAAMATIWATKSPT